MALDILHEFEQHTGMMFAASECLSVQRHIDAYGLEWLTELRRVERQLAELQAAVARRYGAVVCPPHHVLMQWVNGEGGGE